MFSTHLWLMCSRIFIDMRRMLAIIAGFTTIFVCAVQASAHHGWSGYRTEMRETMTVTEVRWINPHDVLRATDTQGNEWELLLAPPARNRNFGFGPGTIEVGDQIEVLGAKHPSRFEAKVHTIEVGGDEVYRYYYSSGQDSQQRLGGTVQESRNRRRN